MRYYPKLHKKAIEFGLYWSLSQAESLDDLKYWRRIDEPKLILLAKTRVINAAIYSLDYAILVMALEELED